MNIDFVRKHIEAAQVHTEVVRNSFEVALNRIVAVFREYPVYHPR